MVSYRESQFSRLKQYQPPAGTATTSGSSAEWTPAHPSTSAPRTHLPETVAIAGCPWIPSGSSCKGSGRSGRSAGAAGPSSREEGVIPPVAGRARTARGRQRPGPRRARPARPASPGRWRSRGGEGRRGVVWSVENPHGPPREGPAVTSAPAAGRGWGGSSLGLGILLGRAVALGE